MRINSIAIRVIVAVASPTGSVLKSLAMHHTKIGAVTSVTKMSQSTTILITVLIIQCSQHVVAGWLTIGPHLSAPNVREDSTSNVLHKQDLPWSIFEASTAGPARPVFRP